MKLDRSDAAAAAEESATEARERLESMLECAPAFIIGFDKTGLINFINRTLPQYTKAGVLGLHWLTFFSPDDQVVMAAKLRAMYELETVQVYETQTSGPDGRPLWFESQMSPVRAAGVVVGAVIVSQDVTERKRTQAELLSSRHMALLGTLAAGIGHEINTPIQFVSDSVQFLCESTKDLLTLLDALKRLRLEVVAGAPIAPAVAAAQVAEEHADLPYLRDNLTPAFDRCVEGLAQIAKIVRSLKDFAHLSGDEMAPTDLNRVVRNALNIATNELKFVANLETHFDDLPPITCHATEIGQVVLNIVVNAAHAVADVVEGTDRKGLITVATRYEKDAAVISVTDTGGGIAPAVQSRIFDPFFTTKEVGRGTGQGLAIAWAMVKERHGGTLTFETEVGKGTTFVIRLPNPGDAYRSTETVSGVAQVLSSAV